MCSSLLQDQDHSELAASQRCRNGKRLLPIVRLVSGSADPYNDLMTSDGKATQERTTFRMEIGVAIAIDAPPETIWALLTDAEGFPEWNSVVTSIEGTIAEGEKLKLRVPYADRTFTPRVVSMDAPRTMMWADGNAVMFRGERRFTLVPDGGRTRFEMTEVFSGLMLPMIAGSLPDFVPTFEAYARDLKKEAEKG